MKIKIFVDKDISLMIEKKILKKKIKKYKFVYDKYLFICNYYYAYILR